MLAQFVGPHASFSIQDMSGHTHEVVLALRIGRPSGSIELDFSHN